ncbi:MAG: hypothetical protein ACK5Q5_02255 [Planctomycetaceae bacterium]
MRQAIDALGDSSAAADPASALASTDSPPVPQTTSSLSASDHEQRREALITLLLRGASPAAACLQLGLSIDQFQQWVCDAEFRERLLHSQGVLSQNVAAALYRSAMEGSVSAQTFYLRHLPPPEWPRLQEDEVSVSPDLAKLSDEELLERFRARIVADTTAELGTTRPASSDEMPG